jgi:hypothetical protein
MVARVSACHFGKAHRPFGECSFLNCSIKQLNYAAVARVVFDSGIQIVQRLWIAFKDPEECFINVEQHAGQAVAGVETADVLWGEGQGWEGGLD